MSSGAPAALPSHLQVAVLVFMKSLASPLVLYADNANQLYEEMQRIIRAASPQNPKLIEKQGVGPLKKVSFLDTEVSGVALQLEPAFAPRP